MSEGPIEIAVSPFLQTCEIQAPESKVKPFVMVIFGGTGDLSKRKLLPTLLHIFEEGEIPSEFAVLGISRAILDDDQYRNLVKEAIQESGEEPLEQNGWIGFSRHLYYLSADIGQDESYPSIRKRVEQLLGRMAGNHRHVIYYLAISPQMAPVVIQGLRKNDLCQGDFDTKIIIEKPFGRDRLSAAELNKVLTDAFEERQIYRIDHYLGKDTVQNILFFRFSNNIFEQLWNRHHIDHIQITVAESLGVENRGAYYEQSGVVRDMVQNHILQLIGMIAMEPPVGFEADYIRDEKLKVFLAFQPFDQSDIDQLTVRGQYGPGKMNDQEVQGYRGEKGVASDSNIPTFFAGKFHIANWRWAGVPFYVRTGKRMAKRITEIAIQFKQPPLRLFGRTCDTLDPNILLLTIQPEEKISLSFGVKYPHSENQIRTVNMVFSYQETFRMRYYHPYERLLIDCMKGDLTLFVREDAIEAMWHIVDPIVARWESISSNRFPNYEAGTWGPPEANRLLERDGRQWITK
jgi:glucose-6-phosphate 1-dehydrogenase